MQGRALLAAALAGVATVLAATPADAVRGSRYRDAVAGPGGAVATESYAASRVGRAVLERGGNAVDAAVATVFAAGVARPQSCGIGGGGFLVYRSRRGRAEALDFRETAPAFVRPDTFAGEGLHRQFTGHLTVGVPGTVAGMAAALRRYGTLSLRQAIAPAERLARRGFRVPASLSASMATNAPRLRLFPAAARQYLANGTDPFPAGSRLVQPDLAASLRRIMRGGTRAFYRGTIARRIVRDMRSPRPATGDGGYMALRDLAAYRAKWRRALRGSYNGTQVIAMPPPTSGGIAILEMLNLLERFPLRTWGETSADTLHVIAEAQKIAFADRGAYVADPDAYPVPTAALISKGYADSRRPEIDLARARSYSPGLGAPAPPQRPGRAARLAEETPEASTTHISVVDRSGNAVAVTCTIEQEFGSAVVAPGTGFLLNNELTDFGAAGTANEPGPGKRPRSSMSPTILTSNHPGHRIAALGGAGGVRIIMGVLHPILHLVDFDHSLAEAIDAQRLDAGGASVAIEEARFDPRVVADLERRGHRIAREGEYGPRPRVQGAARVSTPSTGSQAVSDPRTDQASLAERVPSVCAPSRSVRCRPPR